MQYIILTAKNTHELAILVTEHSNCEKYSHFQLHDGVFINNYNEMCQAAWVMF